MRLKIRVYNPYDLDIVALMATPNFSVAYAMKQTLKYYAEGKRYLVEIPVLSEETPSSQYVKGFYVELDEVKDANAIAFIKTIPEGLRNSFMKNIFRASFEAAPVSLYMGEGGSAYVANLIANPRYGRHPVPREIIDPVTLADGEIGVILSDDPSDVSKLPQGVNIKDIKKKDRKDTLRSCTEQAYGNAMKREEEIKKRRQAVVSTPNNDNTADLDDLLDSMM